MKLGVNVGYWGFGIGAAQQLEIARTAEALGYDSIWTAESYGSDSATVLAWLAAQTSRIKLGASIFQIPAIRVQRVLCGATFGAHHFKESLYGCCCSHRFGRSFATANSASRCARSRPMIARHY